jgi:hypothetical protein
MIIVIILNPTNEDCDGSKTSVCKLNFKRLQTGSQSCYRTGCPSGQLFDNIAKTYGLCPGEATCSGNTQYSCNTGYERQSDGRCLDTNPPCAYNQVFYRNYPFGTCEPCPSGAICNGMDTLDCNSAAGYVPSTTHSAICIREHCGGVGRYSRNIRNIPQYSPCPNHAECDGTDDWNCKAGYKKEGIVCISTIGQVTYNKCEGDEGGGIFLTALNAQIAPLMVYVMVLIILHAKLVNIKTPTVMAAKPVLKIIGRWRGVQRVPIVSIKPSVDRVIIIVVNIENADPAPPVNLIHRVARTYILVQHKEYKNIKYNINMLKKGYIYCFIPVCEIKLYCIDITYDYNDIKDKEIILIKRIYNPNKVKKLLYKKYKKSLIMNNIFSSELDIKELKKFFNRIKGI